MTRLPVLVFLRNISLYTGRNLIYMCYIYVCTWCFLISNRTRSFFFNGNRPVPASDSGLLVSNSVSE